MVVRVTVPAIPPKTIENNNNNVRNVGVNPLKDICRKGPPDILIENVRSCSRDICKAIVLVIRNHQILVLAFIEERSCRIRLEHYSATQMLCT